MVSVTSKKPDNPAPLLTKALWKAIIAGARATPTEFPGGKITSSFLLTFLEEWRVGIADARRHNKETFLQESATLIASEAEGGLKFLEDQIAFVIDEIGSIHAQNDKISQRQDAFEHLTSELAANNQFLAEQLNRARTRFTEQSGYSAANLAHLSLFVLNFADRFDWLEHEQNRQLEMIKILQAAQESRSSTIKLSPDLYEKILDIRITLEEQSKAFQILFRADAYRKLKAIDGLTEREVDSIRDPIIRERALYFKDIIRIAKTKDINEIRLFVENKRGSREEYWMGDELYLCRVFAGDVEEELESFEL